MAKVCRNDCSFNARLMGTERRVVRDAPPLICAELSTVVGLVVAAQVSAAEGIAIRAIGSECRIVTGSIVKLTITFRLMAETTISIARSILRARAEPLVFSSCDERRHTVIGRRRRCLRVVVRMRGAAGCKKRSRSDHGKSNTREFHGVPHYRFTLSSSTCVRIGKRLTKKNVAIGLHVIHVGGQRIIRIEKMTCELT